MTSAIASPRPTLLGRLQAFFYDVEHPYALAGIRMVLPWVLMVAVLPRWPVVRELYSTDGVPTPLWDSYGHLDLLPILPPWLAVAAYTLLILLMVGVSLGCYTRFSLVGMLVLYGYFGTIDCVSTTTKYTVVAVHLLLLLTLSRCGDVWSIDAWRMRAAGEAAPRSPAWPRRLIQLFLGIMYLGAAITKLKAEGYFTGDHLTYWMLTDANFPNPLGDYMSMFPVTVVVASYTTFLWEILFLFLAWRGTGRLICCGLGIFFHAMTLLTLGLVVFPMISITIYLSFLSEAEARTCGETLTWPLRRLANRWSSVSASGLAAFRTWGTHPVWFPAGGLLVMAVILCGAVQLEWQLDVYGERRSEGPYALTPVAPERARELLRNDVAVAAADKLFAFDVGTTLMGGVLADRRATFRDGETAVLQASLVPPHEDMWVEYVLHDSEGQLLELEGQVVTREELRSHFFYQLELPPGEYRFGLRLAGQLVGSRTVTVQPGDSSRGDVVHRSQAGPQVLSKR